MSKGIMNFHIETALKAINDEDLNDNFVWCFSSEQNEWIY